MPGVGVGLGTLASSDADGDDRFLAELAKDFLQSGPSLELPASLGDFGTFPSPSLDLPKQARLRLALCLPAEQQMHVCARSESGALHTCTVPYVCLAFLVSMEHCLVTLAACKDPSPPPLFFAYNSHRTLMAIRACRGHAPSMGSPRAVPQYINPATLRFAAMSDKSRCSAATARDTTASMRAT